MVAFANKKSPKHEVLSSEITLDKCLGDRNLCAATTRHEERHLDGLRDLIHWPTNVLVTVAPKTPIHVIQRPNQEKRSRFYKCSIDDNLPNAGKHSYRSILSHRRART